MNIIAFTPETVGLMPKIIFWILLILCAIGQIYSLNPGPNPNANVPRMNGLVTIILFAIVGLYLFGF